MEYLVHVDTEARTYGEIFDLESMNAAEAGKPIVVAESKDQLRKLQDDLRRAGYRKVK